MNKIPLFAALITAFLITGCRPSLDPETKKMNAFVDQLMAQMTIEEKLGQLNLPVGGDIVTGEPRHSHAAEDIRAGRVGGLFNLKGAQAIREVQRIAVEESRLGIPLLFGMDVIHGYETVFPIPLGLSCSWDLAAIERSAQIAACEATADGICWTFSPMVDICHDGRWGRISEGSGEDPYLGSRVAEAMVRGYQQEDLANPETMMACVKHFALYGAVEAGREYNNVYPDDFHMFNEYLQPYKAAVDAGAGSVMVAFNTVHGVPCSGNKWLLNDLLREQWGFQGFVVSDYCGLEQLQDHGVCSSLEEASIQCLEAGLDMDMVSAGLLRLADAIRAGRCSIKTVDKACRRMLEAKYKLGLFDDPYRYCDTTRREQVVLCAEHRAQARRIAAESMVLLKNEKSLLPLKKKGTIALIGPLANTRPNMSGTWAVAAVPERYKTVKEGLEDALRGTGAKLLYAKGSNLMYDAAQEAIATMFGREMRDPRSAETMKAEALRIARQADVIIAAMGEASEMSGECSSHVNIEMPDAQHDLLVELAKLGKPIVLVHFAGRPTVLNWEAEHLPAILESWFGGSETADAIADILFGDVNPSGRLTVQLPRHVGQYPFSYRQMRTSRLNPGGEFNKFTTCYADVSNGPLYPFGYGLSYTSFAYSPMKLSSTTMPLNGQVTASVTVTNTGNRAGAEVVQLYIGDRVAKGVRPYKELRGFERITLAPGESKEVSFTLDADLMGYFEPEHLTWTLEPGEVEIMIGRNARETEMQVLTITSFSAACGLKGERNYEPVQLQGRITHVQPMTGMVLWNEPAERYDATHGDCIALEFQYIQPCRLVTGKENGKIQYDWTFLEEKLNAAASRGHQMIVRFPLCYPSNRTNCLNKKGATFVPDYIRALPDYHETYASNPGGDGPTWYPDWSNSELQWFVKQFYTDLAEQYNHDPRFAFVEVGFGHWGEGHTYGTTPEFGRNFPTKAYQREFFVHLSQVMNIPWLTSIDGGDEYYSDVCTHEETKDLAFGLFDDTFMHAEHELEKGDGWNERCWQWSGMERWRKGVCGGEISYYTPNDQLNFLCPTGMYGYTWEQASAKYHMTFVICNDAPRGEYFTPSRVTEAGIAAGYNFTIVSCETNGRDSRVKVRNTGIAPIYRDAFVTINGKRAEQSLCGLLPGEEQTYTVQQAVATPDNVRITSDYILPTQTIEFEVE